MAHLKLYEFNVATIFKLTAQGGDVSVCADLTGPLGGIFSITNSPSMMDLATGKATVEP
jgi:hypothetical protein